MSEGAKRWRSFLSELAALALLANGILTATAAEPTPRIWDRFADRTRPGRIERDCDSRLQQASPCARDRVSSAAAPIAILMCRRTCIASCSPPNRKPASTTGTCAADTIPSTSDRGERNEAAQATAATSLRSHARRKNAPSPSWSAHFYSAWERCTTERTIQPLRQPTSKQSGREEAQRSTPAGNGTRSPAARERPSPVATK